MEQNFCCVHSDAVKRSEQRATTLRQDRCILLFAERVKAIRLAEGMTQARFGSLFSLSANVISNYERARTQPSLKFLVEASRRFGVTPDYLLGIDDD